MTNSNVANILKTASEKFPLRIAVEIKRGFRYERFTYLELYVKSLQLAALLSSRGLKRGDKVAIWAPNMPEWVWGYFGSLDLGLIVVPIDVKTSTRTAAKFIQKTEPKLLLTSKFLSDAKTLGVATLVLEDLVDLLSEGRELQEFKGFGDDIAQIVFTSGTTGEPKGVILTHKNLISNLSSLLTAFPGDPNYRFLSILPLSHMYEQVVGLLAPLSMGARITYISKINSLTIASCLRKSKTTAMILVPQVLRLLLNALYKQAEERGKLRRFKLALKVSSYLPATILKRLLFHEVHKFFGGYLEFIACGGAPLDKKLIDTWERMGITILQGYGATEATSVLAINTFKDRKSVSVGKLLPGVSIRISRSGELLARGENLTPGYYQDETATDTAFVQGWYKTGDRGFLDKEGFLYLLGREKFMIVLPDGRNVYPEDIERKLNSHPLVKESCVVGPKRREGEVVHATVITEHPQKMERIVKEINQTLESHQQILEYSLYPETDYPRTHNLKIKRNEVLAWVQDRKQIKKEPVESKKEDKLIELIVLVCQVKYQSISESDNLVLALGLDSLKRIELLSLIEEEFAVSVEEGQIDSQTTVSDLRDLVKRGEKVKEQIKFTAWPRADWAQFLRSIIQALFIFPMIRFFCLISLEGEENLIRLKTPVILIFNHTSHLDTPLILKILPPKIRKRLVAAAAHDYWHKNKLLSILVSLIFNAFPFVRQGRIKPSLEYMGELIDQEWSVLISPEGTRSLTGKLGEFKSGSGLMAVQMGVSVVTIKIEGLYQILPKGRILPKRGSVRVRIGKPLVFNKNTDYTQATRMLHSAIEKL